MYLLGTTLTKLLATVAAVMTVTAGLPRTECRCPDGRIKLFCHGNTSAPSGCCATACSSSPDANPCCCEAKKANTPGATVAKERPCCAHAHAGPKGSGGGGHPALVKASCCVKTVVAAPAVDSVENTGTPVHQTIDVLALGVPTLVVPHATADVVATHSPPLLSTAPPDLVVVLCHFTC